MKRKTFIALFILTCFCSLLTLASCNPILDLIFGPEGSADSDTAHVHQMEEKTYTGNMCTGQNEVKYYQCKSCNKCYLDKDGKDEFDPSTLTTGHRFVIVAEEKTHCSKCKDCNTVKEGSVEEHYSNHWRYNSQTHYKLCDVCNAKFAEAEHDDVDPCSCGYTTKYEEICNSRYGYKQLSSLKNGNGMQQLYNKIDAVISDAHNNKNVNAQEDDGYYYITVPNCTECSVSVDEAYMTVSTYRNDNPLYYWLDRTVAIPPSIGYVGTIKLSVGKNYITGEARVNKNEVIYAGIDDYMSNVQNLDDPYDVALSLHDQIIKNIDYAYVEGSNGSTPETSLWAHGIEGVFTRNSAVCEGYAKAFQLLLNMCKVDNVYVTGSVEEGDESYGHAWNMVNLGENNWYLYDLTWDDNPGSPSGVRYNYFCKIQSDFEEHKPGPIDESKKIDYLYDLPVVATTPYQTSGLEINQIFGVGGLSFRLIGDSRVELVKCTKVADNGILEIPSNIRVNGKTYRVTQIGDEAFATYKYKEDGSIDSVISPSITKIIIPSSVEVIYNDSFKDCKTLIEVEFAVTSNWLRYIPNRPSPDYKQISASDLDKPTTAAQLLKEYQPIEGTNKGYPYVWVRNPV